MPPLDNNVFYTYKTGRLTIIGFDGRHLNDGETEQHQEALLNLIKEHLCEILIVDLMDVPVVSSWILGVLAGIHRQGVRIELYHPTVTMREVLEVTHLNRMLHIRDTL
jgi:anti-anti-sigma factor